ncbi:class I SAM-dependent methyltransferase [Candidatus Pelagibacter sp. Uisw_134_02]|jgi:23S rRNA U2552 (ribose-2'-O)-methylase RlmE/FtsJ|uniref:class I SAM-dependent methyltransferase n=1 Tax=Candidatus Pelagibacter sp. Uisw_134_02 TaxID=3230990 RepID=UPI0039EC6331
MNNIDYNEPIAKELLKENSHLRIMTKFLDNKENPKVLELGVERGSSTKAFLWYLEKKNGKLFSVDIQDCSKVANSKIWNFIQSDDLNSNYILKTFDEIKKEGIDLIYIDSYHENYHVLKLLNIWFKYLKKDGAIFIDDIDSYPFRKNKDIWNSIVYDLTSDIIKEFYYNNNEKVLYTKHFGENGLGKIYKLVDFNIEANKTKKIWNYNIFIKIIYPYLRMFKKLISLK